MALVGEVSLIVGCADDRAVSQKCQKPAAMFVYLDSIEVESSVERFSCHLSTSVRCPIRSVPSR